ncbi:MAG: hypothetical protein GTN76_01165, partial [Candidatus Aenigmarchaeota archaeon]|nr:hypothetical protein [Candidatus Aenigmarchaeota archaeon]
NETRRKERLENKREELEKEIHLERNLTVSEPRIIGAALVRPVEKEHKTEGMIADKEIEKVGMDITLGFEKENGWI